MYYSLYVKSLAIPFLLLLKSPMKLFLIIFVLAVASLGLTQRQKHPVLPERIPATSLDTSDRACPSSFLIDEEVRKTKNIIRFEFSFQPCECGRPG